MITTSRLHATAVFTTGMVSVFEEGTQPDGLRRFRYSIIGVGIGMASDDNAIIQECSEDAEAGDVLATFINDLIHNADCWDPATDVWATAARDEMRKWLEAGQYGRVGDEY